MSLPPLTPAQVEVLQREVQAELNREAETIVTTSPDDLVSLTMDTRFRVTEFSFRGLSVDPERVAALEEAVIACVNGAIADIARRNGERVSERLRKVSGHS